MVRSLIRLLSDVLAQSLGVVLSMVYVFALLLGAIMLHESLAYIVAIIYDGSIHLIGALAHNWLAQ